MNPEISRTDIVEAAELILGAESAVVLSGAGISTPSGIPDFRSLGSGLWEIYNPMEVASLNAFRYNPEKVFDWARPLVTSILSAEPNDAHFALAHMEERGLIKGIITQNIDNLHTRAGSKQVLEIHGHMRNATCVNCFHRVMVTDQIQQFVENNVLPLCEKCRGLLKPDFVLFGEQLPFEIVREAKKLINSSDLMLILGSSLEVVPVAYYPIDALNAGAKLIIINHEPTYLDDRASYVFHHDVAEILPAIAAEVLNE